MEGDESISERVSDSCIYRAVCGKAGGSAKYDMDLISPSYLLICGQEAGGVYKLLCSCVFFIGPAIRRDSTTFMSWSMPISGAIKKLSVTVQPLWGVNGRGEGMVARGDQEIISHICKYLGHTWGPSRAKYEIGIVA